MIIQALVKHYDLLASNPNCEIPADGYSDSKVSYALDLSGDGELLNIVGLREVIGKKKITPSMTIPVRMTRGNGTYPYFACDVAKYVLGIEIDKKSGNVPQLCLKKFEAFKALQHTILDGVVDGVATAYLNFLDRWDLNVAATNALIQNHTDILSEGFIAFSHNNEYLHNNVNVKRAYSAHYNLPEPDERIEQCIISGKIEPISRTHRMIKGIPGSATFGVSLVNFNDETACSYGHDQGYNAPIGKSSMFKYTTAIEYLLDMKRKNRLRLGDLTLIYWAETTKPYAEAISSVWDTSAPQIMEDGKKHIDIKAQQLINDNLENLKNGLLLKEMGIDKQTDFYMLGVCPNNTRLAVRYWYHNTIGNFIEQVAQHYRDIDIGTNFDEPITSPYRILNETVSQKSRDKQPAPGLDKQLIRAIIEGTQYPLALYGAIINRVNVDSSINKHRAGFIKAYLNRMMRSNKNNHKELITMYLNENNNETPYLLGRLFAVLEKLQSDATGSGKNGKGELNSTIKDKYFSSASKTPLQVFPTLINLSTYHLKKLYAETKWGFKTDALINDIMGKLPDERYPKSLSMADQGLFQIGYFHQRTALFKKRDVVETVGEGQL